MAKKKSTKKVYKKGPTKTEFNRTQKSRAISFLIGVITVVVIGFLIFIYTQTNNYKNVLGTEAQNEAVR